MSHHHHHGHQQAVASNVAAFNIDVVKEYDTRESTIKLSKVISHVLLSYPKTSFRDEEIDGVPAESAFFTKEKSLLDFACGTGLVTQYFAPYVKDITGIDVSAPALEVFRDRFKGAVKAHELDILDSHKQEQVQSFYESTDLLICSLAYHHLHDCEAITKTLAQFLKPNGQLFVVDFYNPEIEEDRESTRAPASQGVTHMGGLKKSVLTNTFSAAGLVDITVDEVIQIPMWQEARFISHHCQQKFVDALNAGSLPSKTEGSRTLYYVDVSLVVASGRKP